MFRSPIFILIIFSFLSCSKTKLEKENINNNLTLKKARLFLDKGDENYSQQKFDSAFYNYNISKTTYELKKDSFSIAYNLIQMARIQQISGDYFGAETNLIEVLPFVQKSTDYKPAVYNLLGISSKELLNFDDALENYKLAKKYSLNILSKYSIENNIARIYIQKKEYKKGITILETIF